MALSQPPKINGEMTLTDAQIKDITMKLVDIRTAFEETDEQPVCDTFYITSTYNRLNTFKINGDTCETLLGLYDNPVVEEETPTSEV